MKLETTTTAGRVRGVLDEGVASFRSIPFAAPPVGPLRFARPQPVTPWDGVRDCDTWGPTAPQPERGFTIIPEPVIPGDDYLNLNVFTPDLGAAGLPVLVWIHGGGFTAGGNPSAWYRGARFAQRGVVVVSVNYRLGALGFLSVDGHPTNRAVHDWLAALTWVQENIAAFGGDPAKVTIAGQSAGGVAVSALLHVPEAASLFRAGAAISGSRPPAITPDDAARLTAAYAGVLGKDPATATDAELVDAQPAADAAYKGQFMPLSPVLDGSLVVDALVDPSKPVLLSCTLEEMDRTTLGLDDETALRRLEHLGPGGAAVLPDAPPWQRLGRAMTENVFQAGVVRFADTLADAGAPTWAYRFDWAGSELFGAVHCLDVPFLFDVLDAEAVPVVAGEHPDQAHADLLHGAMVRFATDGTIPWDRYDTTRRATMVIGDTAAIVDDPWADLRARWF